MSTLTTITASCVHCSWRTDIEGDALREARDVHELMHPGGTVLVGADAAPKAKVAPAKPTTSTNGRVCKRDGCEGAALDRRGRYAGLCATHKQQARSTQTVAQTGKPRGGPKIQQPASKVLAPPTLVDLAQAVDDARADVRAAESALVAAVASLRSALDAA